MQYLWQENIRHCLTVCTVGLDSCMPILSACYTVACVLYIYIYIEADLNSAYNIL